MKYVSFKTILNNAHTGGILKVYLLTNHKYLQKYVEHVMNKLEDPNFSKTFFYAKKY